MCSHETKYCPGCKAAFECKSGSVTQCQCSDIQLTNEQRIFLEQTYTDCLCRNCLLELQNKIETLKEKPINK